MIIEIFGQSFRSFFDNIIGIIGLFLIIFSFRNLSIIFKNLNNRETIGLYTLYTILYVVLFTTILYLFLTIINLFDYLGMTINLI